MDEVAGIRLSIEEIFGWLFPARSLRRENWGMMAGDWLRVQSAKNLSASSAAMQPLPAEVMAWR